MRAADSLNKAKIVIDDTGAIDILELRAKARRMKAKHNVEAIFVDYLQLIRAHTKSNASRENEVSMISGSLKAMAKELNIPVVVLAQLNRQAEQGEKPKLSNLRESGAIEQDADVVAILHREREKHVYGPHVVAEIFICHAYCHAHRRCQKVSSGALKSAAGAFSFERRSLSIRCIQCRSRSFRLWSFR